MQTELTFTNIKGTSGQYSLKPMNIITGLNRKGKTAILDAITLGLLGYIPKLGKKHMATMELCSGTTMSVTLGSTAMKWVRKARGEVSATVPKDLNTPTHMVSLNEFFGATRQQRLEIITNASSGSSVDVDWVAKANEVAKDMPEDGRQEYLALVTKHREDPGQMFAECIAWVKERKSVADKTGKDLEATVSAMQLDAHDEKVPTDCSALVIKKEAELGKLRATVNTERLEYEGKIRQLQLAKAALESIEVDPERLALARGWMAKADRIEQLKKAVIDAGDAERELRQKMVGLEQLKAVVESQRTKLKTQLAMLDKVDGHCPTCRNQSEGWKEQAKASFLGELASVQDEWDQIDAACQELRPQLQEAVVNVNTAKETLEKRQDSFQRASNYVQNHETRQAEITGHQNVIAMYKDLQPPVDRTQEIEAVQGELASLKQGQIQFLAWGRRQQDHKITLKRAQQYDEFRQAYANAGTLLTDLHKLFVSSVIDSITTHANLLIEPILGVPLSFDGTKFTLGPASIETLSGSEEMIVHAGIQMALTRESPERFMILDELGRCDPQIKQSLLNTIYSLLEQKVIHTFVGADANFNSQPPGPLCQVITL